LPRQGVVVPGAAPGVVPIGMVSVPGVVPGAPGAGAAGGAGATAGGGVVTVVGVSTITVSRAGSVTIGSVSPPNISTSAQMSSARTTKPMTHGQMLGPFRSTLMSATIHLP
jgi:hypothetical protein